MSEKFIGREMPNVQLGPNPNSVLTNADVEGTVLGGARQIR
jgi:hypothetical protein